MKATLVYFFLYCGFVLFSCKPVQNIAKLSNEEKKIEKKIDELLSKMTLEEKVGQMNQFTGNGAITGPIKAQPDLIKDISNGNVGSIFNVLGAENTREIQKLNMENSRLKIPIIFGLDVIHGYATIFPIPLGESASWDLDAMELSARIAAVEASAAGINWTFAPMVDIGRDPRWGRVAEGAGEDPYYGSLVAAARVRGFQGKSLKDEQSIVACAKHFAAYGAVMGGRDYNTVDISDRTLHEIYLPPFKAAVDAGVGTFMTAFNELNGSPTTGNSHLLKNILREQWGFRGFVVSDYCSIYDIISHGVAKDKGEAATIAANAGNDMDMESLPYRDSLVSMVKAGKVKESTIDESVRRILRIKFQLGLFDNPYKNCNPAKAKESFMRPEHIQAAREIGRKSIVLLRNSNNILPLKTDVKTIAVIGPLADSKHDMLGTWAGQGANVNKVVTLLEGIRKAVSPTTNVLYSKGCNLQDDSSTLLNAAVSLAKKADVVVIAIGEGGEMSGEARSRAYLNIPGKQEDLVKEVLKTGKPVVVVLMSGRPLTINWLAANAPALLETWFLGSQAGNAIADVLFGKYNPSGKLTMSFPYAVGQIPVFYNFKSTGHPKTGDKNPYSTQYTDIPNEPLFPFGFGLSYTRFEYSDIKLSANQMKMNDSITVSVTVKNTGNYDGEEVVQLYIRDLVGSVTRPVKELKGFRKVMIKKGKSADIIFVIKLFDLAFFTYDMSYKAELGDFNVFVGTSSANCKEAAFSLIE